MGSAEFGFKLHLGSFSINVIADNNIGNIGSRSIVEKLTDAKWIHTLNLGGNKITDDGARDIADCIEQLREELKPNCLFLCNVVKHYRWKSCNTLRNTNTKVTSGE